MDSVSICKKKRVFGDEKRLFNDVWTSKYFFILFLDKPVCLICNDSISVLKEYNLKRHYESKHMEKFDTLQGILRKEKNEVLKKQLQRQQYSFVRKSAENDTIVKTSYVIAEKIAKRLKPFSDGAFVKECLEAAAEILCPAQKHLFTKVSLSRDTVVRRIDDMAEDLQSTLKEKASHFVSFAIAIDESTDMTDTAQLAIFVRGIDENFKITEELLSLEPMKGTTKGLDIYNKVMGVLDRFNLKIKNMSALVTDGAPAMIGKNEGLVAHIKKNNYPLSFMQFHCIIHQQSLCAKSFNFPEVMKVLVTTVNFIRSRGLNHRQFQAYLAELDAEYGDVLYFTDVRWLSRGKMMERFFHLKDHILNFLVQKGKEVPELKDRQWLSDFAFLTDLTGHLNDLNTRLQGKDNLINTVIQNIKAFEMKLSLWESRFNKCDLSHFPKLSTAHPTSVRKYSTAIAELKGQFEERFRDFKEQEKIINLFSNPFTAVVDDSPPPMQMELIDLQCNSTLKEKFDSVGLHEFYSKYVTKSDYPAIRQHALNIMSMFSSTYLCEQLFSRMKLVKSKSRNRMTDSNLQNSLRIATSNFQVQFDKLVTKKQAQLSH